jgi:hypothetical protein
LGWATVTHPFHPLSGQRLRVLQVRQIAGREVLSLRDEHHGSIGLPREWTDQSVRSPGSNLQEPTILDAASLLQLSKLIQGIKKGIDNAK